MMKKTTGKIKWLIFVYLLAAAVCIFFALLLRECACVGENASWGLITSIIGGCFGGIGTLYAVYFTLKDEHDNSELDRRKDFVFRIAELIGEFETNQATYYWGSYQIEMLTKQMQGADIAARQQMQSEIDTIRFRYGGIRVPENRSFFAISALVRDIPQAKNLLEVLDRREEEDKVVQEAKDKEAVEAWIDDYRKQLEEAYQRFSEAYSAELSE